MSKKQLAVYLCIITVINFCFFMILWRASQNIESRIHALEMSSDMIEHYFRYGPPVGERDAK